MSDKYIDQTGLARILTNLKANFATKAELQNAGGGGSVSYMSDQEVIDILNDNEEAWTGLEKVKTLWENASPSSRFAAQTVTLSEELSNYDFYQIVFCVANTTALNLALNATLTLPTDILSGGLSFIAGSNHGGYRYFTASGSSVTFDQADFNSVTSASRNDYIIPKQILGINL